MFVSHPMHLRSQLITNVNALAGVVSAGVNLANKLIRVSKELAPPPTVGGHSKKIESLIWTDNRPAVLIHLGLGRTVRSKCLLLPSYLYDVV